MRDKENRVGFEPASQKNGFPARLTPEAARMIKRAMATEQLDDHALRVGVLGGGCFGFQYLLDFDDSPEEDDFVDEQHGVTVLIDPFSAELLEGTTIDYVRGSKEGFRFDNPRITRSPGSGGG